MTEKTKRPWIDISVLLREGMVHWPEDPPVSIKRVKDIEHGAKVNLSINGQICGCIVCHTGNTCHFDHIPVEANSNDLARTIMHMYIDNWIF